ncbi:MAG: hypothetical protein V4472_17550 [Pseudomonadota bacterium]
MHAGTEQAGAKPANRTPRVVVRKMSDEEVDAFASRPIEQMNLREGQYYAAYQHLMSREEPSDPDNARSWANRKLRVTVSSVAREAGGLERGPIGHADAAYGWIWHLVERARGKAIEPIWSTEKVGPRGLAASLQASRSLLADQIVVSEQNAEKAALYDALRNTAFVKTARKR